MSETSNAALERLTSQEYQYGFVTDIDEDAVPPGLNQETVRLISAKKREPEWLLDWRLKALDRFLRMLEEEKEPTWANVRYPAIDYQKIIYYAAPKQPEKLESLDHVDPELLRTYEKLGIPLSEQKRLSGVAKVLRDSPDPNVAVAGFTDSSGSADYNRALSEKRAESIRQYLVNAGIDPARLAASGYGEENPVSSNSTPNGRAQNRRIEFRRLN